MKNILCLVFLSLVTVFGIMGCTVNLNLKPVLSSSLSMDAFEKMGKIDLHDVKMALYIDPKLKELKVDQNIKVTYTTGHFSLLIGKAFSVKLIKALSYYFRTIYFIESPDYAGTDTIDAIMYINMEDIDVNLGLKLGITQLSTETHTRFSIRAEIKDADEKKTVCVVTSQEEETINNQGQGPMYFQEAERQFAIALDNAIDKAIVNLINQMNKSQDLRSYIDKWEQKHKTRVP